MTYTYNMESKRILYSDKHYHDLRLSEQQMGIIQHSLFVLAAAFSLEPDYLELITQTQAEFIKSYESPVIETE